MPRNLWTPEQDSILIKDWPSGRPVSILAVTFGKTEFAIRARASRLGLRRDDPVLCRSRYIRGPHFTAIASLKRKIFNEDELDDVLGSY